MEPKIEGQEPQNTPEEEVKLSKADYDDLKHRADVSSQNFERLKKLQEEKDELEAQILSGNIPSDDIAVFKGELSELKTKLAKAEVIERYPILKESWNDFETFRNDEENKGMNLNTAAKSFLVEKGLLDPQRKGLEKPTGGARAPVSSGMTPDEVRDLRVNNYEKYRTMVKNGDIKV